MSEWKNGCTAPKDGTIDEGGKVYHYRDIVIMGIIATLGYDGKENFTKGIGILERIADRLREAREKHPDTDIAKYQRVESILSEVKELRQAYEHESPERQDDEALDVVATCVRFLNREWEHK